jgi:hypothetical protein
LSVIVALFEPGGLASTHRDACRRTVIPGNAKPVRGIFRVAAMNDHSPPPPELEELAAFADGTLPARRRRELAVLIADSPELAGLVDEQRRAIAVVRATVEQTAAPQSLRIRVDALPGAVRRRHGLAAVAAVAAAIAALGLGLPADQAPSALAAVTLGGRPATAPAPASGEPGFLRAAVEGLNFPRWTGLGWKSTGAREDTLAGRKTMTVFYEKEGKRVAYTIVGGKPLTVPPEARGASRGGKTYALLATPRGRAVAWLQDGRTCVLAGNGVSPDVLLKLASWRPAT